MDQIELPAMARSLSIEEGGNDQHISCGSCCTHLQV